jgi:hypothetical protein
MLHEVDTITKRLDAKAAATSDLLTDAAKGWELVRQMEQNSKEMPIEESAIVDGFTLDAFWDEVDRRPNMGAPLTADEVAAFEAGMEEEQEYVLFQQPSDFYNVLPAEQREDWIGA